MTVWRPCYSRHRTKSGAILYLKSCMLGRLACVWALLIADVWLEILLTTYALTDIFEIDEWRMASLHFDGSSLFPIHTTPISIWRASLWAWRACLFSNKENGFWMMATDTHEPFLLNWRSSRQIKWKRKKWGRTSSESKAAWQWGRRHGSVSSSSMRHESLSFLGSVRRWRRRCIGQIFLWTWLDVIQK